MIIKKVDKVDPLGITSFKIVGRKKSYGLGYDYNYLEYEINFKCKCGEKMIIDGNDDWRGNVCPKCKRKYQFQMSGTLKQVKNEK